VDYEGKLAGTPAYIAPEVALGHKEEVDARADLFSFGVVMRECLTWGGRPFARPTDGNIEALRQAIEREASLKIYPPSAAHAHKPGFVPEYLDTIVMRLIAHRPADRFYGNARAVINALTTRMPDAFKDSAETKSSYLAPENDRHIEHEGELNVHYFPRSTVSWRAHSRVPRCLRSAAHLAQARVIFSKKLRNMPRSLPKVRHCTIRIARGRCYIGAAACKPNYIVGIGE